MKTKITAVALIIVMLCTMCYIMSACPKKDEKYDVSMKVVCKEVVNGHTKGAKLGEWIFTPDNSEIHIERIYEGVQLKFYLDGIESPYDHGFPDRWIGVYGEVHTALWKDGDPKENICEYVYERGNYTLLIFAYDTNCPTFSWNTRTLRMYISIK